MYANYGNCMAVTGFQSGEKKIKENNRKSPTNYNIFQATIDCVVFLTYK